jgi:hypothetical protein
VLWLATAMVHHADEAGKCQSGAPTDLYRHCGIDVETIVGVALDLC